MPESRLTPLSMSESTSSPSVSFERRLSLLKNLPSFETLSVEVLNHIAENLGVESFGQHGEVVHEGCFGDRMYLIESGVVVVTVEGATGPVELGNLGEGEMFGEIALLNEGRQRSATVTTLCPMVALTLDIHHFQRLAALYPEVRLDLACAADALMQTRLEALMRAKTQKMDGLSKSELAF